MLACLLVWLNKCILCLLTSKLNALPYLKISLRFLPRLDEPGKLDSNRTYLITPKDISWRQYKSFQKLISSCLKRTNYQSWYFIGDRFVAVARTKLRNRNDTSHCPLQTFWWGWMFLDNRWYKHDLGDAWLSCTSMKVVGLHNKPNYIFTWWRHQMETFSASLVICGGTSSVISEFPAQWPVTRSFDVFLDLRLTKRLSKQRWGRWFETPSCPLWRHCNDHRSPFWSKLFTYLLQHVLIVGQSDHSILHVHFLAIYSRGGKKMCHVVLM